MSFLSYFLIVNFLFFFSFFFFLLSLYFSLYYSIFLSFFYPHSLYFRLSTFLRSYSITRISLHSEVVNTKKAVSLTWRLNLVSSWFNNVLRNVSTGPSFLCQFTSLGKLLDWKYPISFIQVFGINWRYNPKEL